MTPKASIADIKEPILVELDRASWDAYLDSTEKWLDNVLMLQASFRELAEDVRAKIEEPHFHAYLGEVAQKAQAHEERAEGLYRMIGRDPSRLRPALGAVTAKVRQGWADVFGLAGGAKAPWRDLHQLFLSSLSAMSAFGATEQIGYALGLHELANECFAIVDEKYTHHLLLQELTLEMVPWGILYKAPF